MHITPSMIKKAHLTASVAWIILAIPSVIWWKSSVLWVIIISIYANVVGHLSGYTAARADEAAEREEKEKKDKEKN